MPDKIGIVITGCRRDFGVIADNNVVNLNDSSISKVLTDSRKHVLVHKTYVDFYSVEHISNYRIFTGYRSSRDLGRDGYIAVSLFIDRSHSIIHVRNLLKELLDCYFKNYMNPLTWEPTASKNVNVEWFQQIVDKYEVVSLAPVKDIFPGEPKYIVYDCDEKLDYYFDDSSYCDFTHWQKVYYLSKFITDDKDILDLHIQAFNFKVKSLSQVAEQEKPKEKTESSFDNREEDDVMPPTLDVDTTENKDQEILQENKPSKKKIIGLAAAILSVILFGAAFYFYSNSTTPENYNIEGLFQQQDIDPQEVDAPEEVLPVDTVSEDYVEPDSVIPDAVAENLAKKTQKEAVAQVNKQIKILNDKLNRLDITKQDVESILESAKKHGNSELIQRANAYLCFFNAISLDDVQRAIPYFSGEQRRTCFVTYLKDLKTFEYCRKRFGMDFRKAKDFIKSNLSER